MTKRVEVDYQVEIDRISGRLFTIAATDPQGSLTEIAQLQAEADMLLSPKVPDEKIKIQAAYLVMNTVRLCRQYRAPLPLDMDEVERRVVTAHIRETSRSVEDVYRKHIALYDQRQRAEKEQQTAV